MMQKRYTPETYSRVSDLGLRIQNLETASGVQEELGFSTTELVCLPASLFVDIQREPDFISEAVALIDSTEYLEPRQIHSDIVGNYMDMVSLNFDLIEDFTSVLSSEMIIVRPSSLDEARFPELSFAEVYKSYMPVDTISKREHLLL